MNIPTNGSDELVGTDGNDNISALDGYDDIYLALSGKDVVDGGPGTDILRVYPRPWTAYPGGIVWSSWDPASGSGSFYSYYYNVATGDYGQVSFTNIERLDLTGTSYGDYFYLPRGGNSYFSGMAGNDTLEADLSLRGGDHTIDVGYSGGSLPYGILPDGTRASGIEHYRLTTGNGNDFINLLGGFNVGSTATSNGGYSDIVSSGAGNDTVNPGRGDDFVYGGAGSDLLVANYSQNNYAGTARARGITWSSYDPVGNDGRFYAYWNDAGSYDQVTFQDIERFNITGTPQGDYLINPRGGMLDADTYRNSTLTGGRGTDTLEADLSPINTDQQIIPGYDDGDTTMGTKLPDGTQYSGFQVYRITTGNGNDSILLNVYNYSGVYNDVLTTGAGNDTINGALGQDLIYAGAGTDLLVADYSSNLYGGTVQSKGIRWSSYDAPGGNGAFYAYRTNAGTYDQVTFQGVERFDITGTPQGDWLIDPRGGQSQLHAGGGIDTLEADLSRFVSTPVTMTPTNGTLSDGTSYTGFEVFRVQTGGGNDSIRTTGIYNDIFNTNGGNDTIYGSRGHDAINGGPGTDLLVANYSTNTYAGTARTKGIQWSSNDLANGNGSFYAYSNDAGAYDDISFQGIERFNITGTPQADWLIVPKGGMLDAAYGNSTLAGGAGNDTLEADLSSITSSQLIGISGTFADGTVYSGMEAFRLTTGNGSDRITLSGVYNDLITTNGGNDTINGAYGRDVINGGAGVDMLVANYSGNAYAGTVQTNGIRWSYQDQANGNGSFYARRNDAGDYDETTYTGMDVFLVIGTQAGDQILGAARNDTLNGHLGNDTLEGSGGVDSLTGGYGNDWLTGASTAAPYGKGEVDYLTGGAGADVFVLGVGASRLYDEGSTGNSGYADYARINDFKAGEDKLQLKGAAAQYYIGAVSIGGAGVFHEQGAVDELIAAITRDATGPALTMANTIGNALFV